MNRFARLLDDLIFSPSRLAKERLLVDYFTSVPDPARGHALGALTGALDFRHAKPAAIRALVERRVDPELFAWSYDFVGDLAETAALIWPRPEGPPGAPPDLTTIVETLHAAKRADVPDLLADWLDRLDANARWALLKLITGGMRVGVAGGLVRSALAAIGKVEAAAVEEVWHGLEPPYTALFAWLEGRGERPGIDHATAFRPTMLAHALDEAALGGFDPRDFRAEWKWDGIRVQIVAHGTQRRLYTRTGEDVGGAFPDVVEAIGFDAVLDGELLVARDGQVAPFNDLQQRLNRKTIAAALLRDYPGFVRLYDMLFEGGEDIRTLPFTARRERLERWYEARLADQPGMAARFDLSLVVAFASWAELANLRASARARGSEGLMLKRADSPYLAGRVKGHWFKWKRDADTVDGVLIYAQRGHGKRSSFYSDFTFGCWRAAEDGAARELVPVGKAYFGFTDAELMQLDKWVRAHTVRRFGPVREVEPLLVCELAFDSVHRSNRHKSGIALRFPRISRIRWDKPAAEADAVETLAAMIAG